jgi:serine/threonine protein kinase
MANGVDFGSANFCFFFRQSTRVRCLGTIIELMTGEPPYANHTPFSAMYRMVEDDHPPLPTGISQSLESFLLLCFQKNVDLRYTAKVLKRHVSDTRAARKHYCILRRLARLTTPQRNRRG